MARVPPPPGCVFVPPTKIQIATATAFVARNDNIDDIRMLAIDPARVVRAYPLPGAVKGSITNYLCAQAYVRGSAEGIKRLGEVFFFPLLLSLI